MKETDDKGRFPETEENLKLMPGIWGKHALNPECDTLRIKYPNLEGSIWELKNSSWEKVIKQ